MTGTKLLSCAVLLLLLTGVCSAQRRGLIAEIWLTHANGGTAIGLAEKTISIDLEAIGVEKTVRLESGQHQVILKYTLGYFVSADHSSPNNTTLSGKLILKSKGSTAKTSIWLDSANPAEGTGFEMKDFDVEIGDISAYVCFAEGFAKGETESCSLIKKLQRDRKRLFFKKPALAQKASDWLQRQHN